MIRVINKTKKLIANKFVRNIVFISGGTAIAQSLGVFLSPVITRLFTPSDYGILTLFTSVLSFLSLGSFNYEVALPISKDEKKAINLLALCLMIITGFTILTSGVIMIFGEIIFDFFDIKQVYKYRYFLPLGIFFGGLISIFRQWLFREKNYKAISKSTINQSIIGNGAKVLFGLFNFDAIGLIIGRVLTTGSGFFTLLLGSNINRENLKYISWDEIKWNFKRYTDFPIYRTPTLFIQRFSQQLPVLLITSVYGMTEAGFYGLANSIILIPMRIIGDSIADVFYGEAAILVNSNPREIKRIANKILKKTALYSFVPIVIFMVSSPFVFSFIFGEDWMVTGIYARLLCISLYSRLIFAPVSRIFEIFEEQRLKLLLNVILIISVFLSFSISIYFNLSSFTTMLIYSIVIAFFYLFEYILSQIIISRRINEK